MSINKTNQSTNRACYFLEFVGRITPLSFQVPAVYGRRYSNSEYELILLRS